MSIVELISKQMLLEEDYLLTISKSSSARYKRFTIKKRNGGDRVIYQPSKELKSIQRVLLDMFLSKLPIHSYAYAYKSGTTTRDCLQNHSENKYFLKLDMQDFFYSITNSDLDKYFKDIRREDIIHLSSCDITFIKDICCFNKRLVIGAVTSPTLSNAVCFNLDQKISLLCESLEVEYSRYADDLIFSTMKRNALSKLPIQIEALLKKISYPSALRLNHNKTRYYSHNNAVKILGLKITNTAEISIGRQKKREIRSKVYKWNHLNPDEKKHLQGFLAYCRSVDPVFIDELCLKYKAERINDIIHYSGKG